GPFDRGTRKTGDSGLDRWLSSTTQHSLPAWSRFSRRVLRRLVRLCFPSSSAASTAWAHGDRRYQSAVFDFRMDTPVSRREEEAPPHAVLLFDGVFLLRPELADQWDYQIFVFVSMETALQRALQRDLPLFGSAEAVQARYMQRYFPGQRIYYQTVHPHE